MLGLTGAVLALTGVVLALTGVVLALTGVVLAGGVGSRAGVRVPVGSERRQAFSHASSAATLVDFREAIS